MTLRKSAPGSDCGWPESGYVNFRDLMGAVPPTHASWLNQIEIWFGILSRQVVRRGIFASRADLVAKLMAFIRAYNNRARPFAWTYTGSPLAA